MANSAAPSMSAARISAAVWNTAATANATPVHVVSILRDSVTKMGIMALRTPWPIQPCPNPTTQAAW